MQFQWLLNRLVWQVIFRSTFAWWISIPGILDQGQGVLIVFEDSSVDQTYTTALETISSMGKVVDSLYSRAKHLHWIRVLSLKSATHYTSEEL